MITLCFLMAQGGCEPQFIAHAKGNMNLGNDKDFLIRALKKNVARDHGWAQFEAMENHYNLIYR